MTEIVPIHDLNADECRHRWHDEGAGRRPDCPSCGVEDDSYCDDCDASGWLPNDDPDSTPDDWPWKPCPWCNKNAAIPCPFYYVAIEDEAVDLSAIPCEGDGS